MLKAAATTTTTNTNTTGTSPSTESGAICGPGEAVLAIMLTPPGAPRAQGLPARRATDGSTLRERMERVAEKMHELIAHGSDREREATISGIREAAGLPPQALLIDRAVRGMTHKGLNAICRNVEAYMVENPAACADHVTMAVAQAAFDERDRREAGGGALAGPEALDEAEPAALPPPRTEAPLEELIEQLARAGETTFDYAGMCCILADLDALSNESLRLQIDPLLKDRNDGELSMLQRTAQALRRTACSRILDTVQKAIDDALADRERAVAQLLAAVSKVDGGKGESLDEVRGLLAKPELARRESESVRRAIRKQLEPLVTDADAYDDMNYGLSVVLTPKHRIDSPVAHVLREEFENLDSPREN